MLPAFELPRELEGTFFRWIFVFCWRAFRASHAFRFVCLWFPHERVTCMRSKPPKRTANIAWRPFRIVGLQFMTFSQLDICTSAHLHICLCLTVCYLHIPHLSHSYVHILIFRIIICALLESWGSVQSGNRLVSFVRAPILVGKWDSISKHGHSGSLFPLPSEGTSTRGGASPRPTRYT